MITKGNKRILSVSIAIEIASKAEKLAKERRRSLSSIIEDALAEYLEKHGLRRKKAKEKEEIEEGEGESPTNYYHCLDCGLYFEAEEGTKKCERCGSDNLEIVKEYY